MSTPSLLVPINIEALVANDAVVARDSFRWWPFNYLALNHFKSPEPQALARGVTTQPSGVYLHWTLPSALRKGTRQADGTIDYPLVPNRWLVVRAQGTTSRTLTGWVIESDCPFSSKVIGGDVSQSPQYLVDQSVLSLWSASGDPYRQAYTAPAKGVSAANIGVSFPLASGWNERAVKAMFLTAVAPANPLFSGYFPHHQNVFGFYDNLANIPQDSLSYYVVGWYSDPAQDVLTTRTGSYADLLADLNWTISDNDLTVPDRTIYSGGTFSIAWAKSGSPAPSPDPLQDIRDSGKLNVGVGNTTIDAFSALVSQQITDPGTQTLLRAFNYDLLPVLNDVNGPALLEQRIRQEWFGSIPGGYRWTIVDQQSNGDAAATLTTAERAWLAQLNTDQQALDDAVAALATLQWNVQALWYKAGWLSDSANTFPAPPKGAPDVSLINAQLNAATPGTQAAALVAQLQAVRQLMTLVPQPVTSVSSTPESAFQAGIAAFATTKSLDPSKQLKGVPSARYWRANNPVVILSGVDSPYDADPNQPLVVRTSNNAITAITLPNSAAVSRQTAAAAMPTLAGLGSLPPVVATVLDELFLLDPANSTSLAAAATVNEADLVAAMTSPAPPAYPANAIPSAGTGIWSQAWSPLMFEWRGAFMPIAPQTNGADNWTFDGTDYSFTGSVTPSQQVIGGISLLSPHAQFVFGSRLEKYLDTYGGQPALQDIDTQIKSIFKWKFLAQELVGFNDMLALRDGNAFRRPTPSDTLSGASGSLSAMLGFDSGANALPSPMGGKVTTVPLIPNGPALPFQGVRQGQFYFTDLFVYDRFGRTLVALSSTTSSGMFGFKNFPAQLDTPLKPEQNLMPSVVSTLELPPRPLQHARLEVELVDKSSDSVLVSTTAGACPVCAWVLPDHLGNSLLIYGPDGTALGDVRLVTGLDGVTRTAEWTPPPNSTLTSVSELAAVSPHLADFLQAPAFGTEANFTAFMSAIDSALWTVDPLGGRADQNLSVLIGRPLALVRMKLSLELDGDPIRDTGWAATLDFTTPPAYLTQKFAVRLGDQATRQDGTIGYFSGLDYATFNSVVPPNTTVAQTYVTPIGPAGSGQNYLRLSFAPGDSQFITLLIDPRASVHATTGILPVKAIELPAAFVDAPLSNIEVSFAMGPIVAFVQPAVAQAGQTPAFPMSVTYPRPTEQNGTWAWWEAGATGWTGYEVLDATAQASMPPVAASLREGVLQLAVNLKTNLKNP